MLTRFWPTQQARVQLPLVPPSSGGANPAAGVGSVAGFDDLPFDNIHRVTFDPQDENIIYVSTFGSGVWRGPALPVR